MFALGQEMDEHEVIEQKTSALQRTAEFRDQIFDERQWPAVKVIGGTLIGMFFIYRFLMK